MSRIEKLKNLYLSLGYNESEAERFADIDNNALEPEADYFELSRFDPINKSGKTQVIFFFFFEE